MHRLLAETYPDAHCELDFTTPLELVVATILSAQCTDRRVNLVTPALFAPTRAWVAASRDAFLAELARAERPLALSHHDLALEHILVDPSGERVTGVIDWGDLALGDPALDFAGFAGACDAATLAALLAAYGSVDDGFLRRAAWYARLAPFHLLHFGLHTG